MIWKLGSELVHDGGPNEVVMVCAIIARNCRSLVAKEIASTFR